MPDERNYRAFLVRLWTVSQEGGVAWRASAEDAHTGASQGFADLAGLFAFLKAATDTPPRRVSDKPREQDFYK